MRSSPAEGSCLPVRDPGGDTKVAPRCYADELGARRTEAAYVPIHEDVWSGMERKNTQRRYNQDCLGRQPMPNLP